MGFWDKVFEVAGEIFEKAKERAETQHRRLEQEATRRKRSAKATPAYQPGKKGNKTAIILSAPGSAEEKAGRPASGQTGKTLNKFLEQAHKKDPKRFPSTKKDDYTIVNASDEVHYKKKTGRTEAKDKDILDKANVGRVSKAIKTKDTVVALGGKAGKVAAKAAAGKEVLKGDHPSMQSMNRQYKSSKTTPKARAEERVKKYTEDVLKTGKKKK